MVANVIHASGSIWVTQHKYHFSSSGDRNLVSWIHLTTISHIIIFPSCCITHESLLFSNITDGLSIQLGPLIIPMYQLRKKIVHRTSSKKKDFYTYTYMCMSGRAHTWAINSRSQPARKYSLEYFFPPREYSYTPAVIPTVRQHGHHSTYNYTAKIVSWVSNNNKQI